MESGHLSGRKRLEISCVSNNRFKDTWCFEGEYHGEYTCKQISVKVVMLSIKSDKRMYKQKILGALTNNGMPSANILTPYFEPFWGALTVKPHILLHMSPTDPPLKLCHPKTHFSPFSLRDLNFQTFPHFHFPNFQEYEKSIHHFYTEMTPILWLCYWKTPIFRLELRHQRPQYFVVQCVTERQQIRGCYRYIYVTSNMSSPTAEHKMPGFDFVTFHATSELLGDNMQGVLFLFCLLFYFNFFFLFLFFFLWRVSCCTSRFYWY